MSIPQLKRDPDEQIACREIKGQAGEPNRRRDVTAQRARRTKEVRSGKKCMQTRVLGEVSDPSQVFEIALG